MAAANYNLNIEKGVDYSLSLVLQRSDGTFVDLSDSNICVKGDIVEFHGVPAITSFSISENLPSGVLLQLSEAQTSMLPYGECYYDIVLNTNGATERLIQGKILTSEQATTNISCP
jgi:hypothetical protein